MEDYLRDKGININRPFRCLNPDHNDENPSMSYDRKRWKVHCFSCGADWDIFDLVGAEYNIRDGKDKFSKTYELLGVRIDGDSALPGSPSLLPQITTSYHKLPQITTNYHKLPQVTTNYHKLPQITTNYHKLPQRMTLMDISKTMEIVTDLIKNSPVNISYATIAKIVYENIKQFRNNGYSYDIICKAFVESGLLAKGAKPKSLCMAFLRETNYRLRAGTNTTKEVLQAEGGDVKTEQEKFIDSVKFDSAKKVNNQKKAKSEEAQNKGSETDKTTQETEKEWEERVRRETGQVMDMGLGRKVILHTDGSFEY
jgi:hypothetical protein